ncbi:SoxR-reducing system protein RseC [Obesumbacterium proteus]|uniref:SoxR-reducing system protein RseC n=1 Tax=Obesumbacterium proteus TaxID=82983 RepID=UPI0010342AFB|nr:SoxR-reducing system protein RseC [Obesumbacterium proteus]TBL73116.1 SoxR-reducing system protein RseC [Obesumbacterium proteus]
MMREWATVASWQQGIATLNCEQRSGCGSCGAKNTCGTAVLNKINPQSQHQLQVEIAQPLAPGQKVEIGITEANLLRSAVLVYLTPLLGLIVGGGVGQSFMHSDAWAALGALVGAGAGFMFARFKAKKLSDRQDYQPIVLQVGLPPSMIRTPTNI